MLSRVKKVYSSVRSLINLSLVLKISFLFLLVGLLVLVFLGIFQAPLFQIGIALGGRALAYTLGKLGLPMGLTLAIGVFTRGLMTEAAVSEVLVGPLRMMPAGSDLVGHSGGWEKDLNLPSDSEGQGQGIEGEPTSRKRGRSPDPVEDVGPSSGRRQVYSESGNGPSQQVPLSSGSSAWSSFDERVLLEPMPDSSSPSVDEAINAGAPNPPAEAPHGPPPYDPNTDPLRVETKKAEMTLFVKDRYVHFTERGWKPWQFSRNHDHYMEVSSNIVSSLELDSVSEYEDFILAFRKDPKLLESLFTK
jgi:hypothetical protein